MSRSSGRAGRRGQFHRPQAGCLRPAFLAATLGFLVGAISATATGDGDGTAPAPRATSERPNILYIMADDLCYADLSCYGATGYRTPNLDQLATEGVRFTDAYAIAPVCSPTRVGLMTGRYPARTRAGLWEPLTGAGDAAEGLPPDPPTLPLLLKRAGYHTGLVGKWHLGWRPEFRPPRHGFDFSFGPLGGATDYVSHVTGGPEGPARNTPARGRAARGDAAHDLYLNGTEVERTGYLTDLFTAEAVEFLRRATPPFFLSVQYTAPHWPWQQRGDPPYPAGRSWLRDGGSPEAYAEMMRALDDGIGRILALLVKLGYAQNTLVIFTSDNGGDEQLGNRGPFRGRKLQLWEGGIRVPAIVRWPGRVRAGVSTDQVATTLDWSATMLAAAGETIPADWDGLSLLPFLTAEAPAQERTICWRIDQRHRHHAVRSGSWKYLKVEALGTVDRDLAGDYLFDLSRDPGETQDLKAREPEVFARLKARYDQWAAGMLTPIPLGP
ncbi:MAG TPA: sulfatase-like hydrolase/transferase [Opitutaceae bacterium]